jgi:hypothetical protein
MPSCDQSLLEVRRSSSLIFIGVAASLCFHFFALYQFSAWTPSAELASPTAIKATVVTRTGVSVVHNLYQSLKPVASLSPSPPPRHFESVRAQAVMKAEATQDEIPSQPVSVGMQPKMTDSPSVESQILGALSEIAPPTTDVVPLLPISAIIEFSRRGFLGRTIRSTHLWRRIGDHYTLSVEGGVLQVADHGLHRLKSLEQTAGLGAQTLDSAAVERPGRRRSGCLSRRWQCQP